MGHDELMELIHHRDCMNLMLVLLDEIYYKAIVMMFFSLLHMDIQ